MPLNLYVVLLGLMFLVQHFIYQTKMRISMSQSSHRRSQLWWRPTAWWGQPATQRQPTSSDSYQRNPATPRYSLSPDPTRGTQHCQPLQDAPHLQTPTGGTQHGQPLQDAPHLQTPTGGTQHHQPLQNVNIPSSHQDMVLNNSHSAYLYAPYTPVAVRKTKRKRIYWKDRVLAIYTGQW